MVLARIEMESPQQQKAILLVVKKRPKEALFATLAKCFAMRGLAMERRKWL